MKLQMLVIAAVVAAAAAAEAIADVDKLVGVEGYYDNHGHGDRDSYCCYRIKKELEKEINNLESVGYDVMKHVKNQMEANLARVIVVEKRLEEQEDFDYEKLQLQVDALDTVAGSNAEGLLELEDVEKKHHHQVVNEIQRLEEKIGKDETGIQDEINNVTNIVNDISVDLSATKSRLDAAESGISGLANKTSNLDARLRHVGEMTIKGFQDVDGKFQGVFANISAVAAEADANAASIAALAGRTSAAEGSIQRLVEKTDETNSVIGDLTAGFNATVRKIERAVETQGAELKAAEKAHDSLVGVVEALEAESAGNSTRIHANSVAVETLQRVVDDQGSAIRENAEGIAEMRMQLKQVADSVEGLRKALLEHREDIVAQMKKLTDVIAA